VAESESEVALLRASASLPLSGPDVSQLAQQVAAAEVLSVTEEPSPSWWPEFQETREGDNDDEEVDGGPPTRRHPWPTVAMAEVGVGPDAELSTSSTNTGTNSFVGAGSDAWLLSGEAGPLGRRLFNEDAEASSRVRREAALSALQASSATLAAVASRGSTAARSAEAAQSQVTSQAHRIYAAAVQAEKAWLKAQAADEKAAREAHAKATQAREAQLALLHVIALETTAPPSAPTSATAAPSSSAAPAGDSTAAPAPVDAAAANTEAPGAAHGAAENSTATLGARGSKEGAAAPKCGGGEGQLPCTTFLKFLTFGFNTMAWRGFMDWVGLLSLVFGVLSWGCYGKGLVGCFWILAGSMLLFLSLNVAGMLSMNAPAATL